MVVIRRENDLPSSDTVKDELLSVAVGVDGDGVLVMVSAWCDGCGGGSDDGGSWRRGGGIWCG